MTEIVSSILGPIVEKLTSSAVEEIQSVWGAKDDREKLKKTVKFIEEVLADAEQKQTKDANVGRWLSELKDFCYDAEDVLDEFATRALWRRARSIEHLTLKGKVHYLSSWLSDFIFQFEMAHKIKELGKRLDGINEEKTKFELSKNVQEKAMFPLRETHSLPPSNVIGRNKEKEEIIELLIGSNDGAGTIAVISILGMGGTGKTTLAKLVYNDDRVNKHFDCKVWLSMPLEFQVMKILTNMITSLRPEEKHDSLEMLQNRLRSILENKRCLFVMDDVWEVSRNDWVELIDFFRDVHEGSKVIVTTRNKSVVLNTSPIHLHKLAILSEEDSLTLFMKYALDPGQEKNHLDLMIIGKEIVSKCGRNPMAVKTLGASLYSKKKPSDWEKVRDSEMWELETNILPSLRISYDLMPFYLKRCFNFCSIFPKNHEFINLDLIQLWISNGIIQSSGNDQDLEVIGQRYFEELWSRSFFDVVEVSNQIMSVQMHDLIYELAISVAQKESSNMKVCAQNIPQTTRHISFPNLSHVPKDEVSACLSKLSRVRTIMCEELGSSDSEEFFLETCISRFKYLRVLLLQNSGFDLLPSSIGGLKHLRFFSLRDNYNIKKLPKWVYELHNLQTLDLAGCEDLEELPTNIKNMINLRVLWITTKQRRFPESGIGCLTSLLWLFIGDCNNLEALFDDIQSLTSLRKLCIYRCPKLASLPQGIKNLKALEHLMIGDCISLTLPEGEPGSMSRLQSLTLMKLPELVSLPGWLEGSVSTLQMIRFCRCPKLSTLPEWLQNCSSLRTLEIDDCPELSSLPDGIRLIPKLQISDCEKLSRVVEKKMIKIDSSA